MARIYSSENQQTGFQGSARSEGFNPVKAYDPSAQIRQQAAQRVADYQTQGRMAAAQFQLDEQWQRTKAARDLSQMQLDAAYQQSNISTLQKLAGLSQTVLKTVGTLHESQRKTDQENELLASIGWGETPPEETPQEKAELKAEETQVLAEAQATSQVAADLKAENTTESASVANTIQQGTAFQMLSSIKGNTYNAMAAHQPFLAAAIRELPQDRIPKTHTEAVLMVRELNRKFLQQSGMMGNREGALQLARQMSGTTMNTVAGLVSAGIKMQEADNLSAALSFTSVAVDAKRPAEEIWKEVSDKFAFGNLGFTGHSRAANEAALKAILEEYAANGDTAGINALRTVLQRPGQKGTELEKSFDHLFDKYEKKAREGAISEYTLSENEAKVEMAKSVKFYYDDPTPENRQAAIQQLRAIGTESALKEAERLAQNGLGYDPQKKFDLLEMQQAGMPIPEETLKQLLDAGTITPDEYKQFSVSGPAKVAMKEVDTYLKDVGDGYRISMQGKASSTDLTAEVRAQLVTRHEAFKEELRQRLYAEVKANPAIAQDKGTLARLVEQQSQYLLQQPHYKIESDGGKFAFGAPMIQYDKNIADLTVAPGVQDFSRLAPEDIFGKLKLPKAEMDPTKDRFLPVQVLRDDVKAIMEGREVSNRTRLVAKNLNVSPRALINAQLEVSGLPSISALRQEQESVGPVGELSDIKNATDGMKVLQQHFGFPRKGAAFLSGNIQQESGWHGLRQWGEVAGDGTNRNGGLVSWASWANNSARLGAIERHYGKNIAQIPEIDQLKFMVLEMKRRNPSAYRTFMDPNASEAALRKASYQYWGFGHQGHRYDYAASLLKHGRI